MYLERVPNPFLLLPLTESWLQPIRDFDPELRVFPSQLRPVYRVARKSQLLAPMALDRFRRETVHPDTVVALEHGLILVNWSLVANVMTHPSRLLLQTLKNRDTWQFRRQKGDINSDSVADLIDFQDDLEQKQNEAAFKDRTRQIGRAARLSVLYRTGQRVSLAPSFRRAGMAAPAASSESSASASTVPPAGPGE